MKQLAKFTNTYINIRCSVLHASDYVRNVGTYFESTCPCNNISNPNVRQLMQNCIQSERSESILIIKVQKRIHDFGHSYI